MSSVLRPRARWVWAPGRSSL